MKILRSIHSLDPAIGGPLESVKQSTRVLQQRGHEVEILTLDSPAAAGVRDFPAPVHALGPGRGSYGYVAGFVPWLKERRANYAAVIVHGIWQYSSFGVWRALRGSPTPYFVFPHGMLDPWFKRTYPLKHLKKTLYWPWADYRVLRDAAAVLFTSEEERRLARESFTLYRAREVVVNYGTATPEVDWELAQTEFRERFPSLRERKFLLFLGRLHEKKGIDLLIRAFGSLGEDGIQLVIAGPCADDDYLAALQQLARGLPVTFTGLLSGNLKWGALR
ncbi:MAG TPA: glycosyltransferase, partial [Chthoniobacterales bacterium]|nr:glycosyltransferase [Chthoniobacterales bacterium]